MHRIYSFIGDSNSGKTTLILKIIAELKMRNYTVGAVKNCSVEFEIDKKGKDSYRLREEGADPVLLVTRNNIVLFKNNNGDEPVSLIKQYFSDKDYVIVEGGKRWSGIKKIEVVANGGKRRRLREKPVALISDKTFDIDVPQFQKHEIKKIVNFMEKSNG